MLLFCSEKLERISIAINGSLFNVKRGYKENYYRSEKLERISIAINGSLC
jgi:hypothetical protein